MTRRTGLGSFAVAWIILVGPSPARGEDVATAVVQFDRGLEAMLAGNHAVGCPALAESYRLEPLPGTLFTLAECEKRWGRIASAVARYESYLAVEATLASAARRSQGSRSSIARASISELRPRVPTLRVVVDGGWPAQTVVTRDGVQVGAPSLGLALPLDPGEHVVEIRAPGMRPFLQRVAVAAGEHLEVRSGPPRPAEAGVPSVTAPDAAEVGAGDTRRAVAMGIGGVGVASLAVGLVAGGLALGDTSAIERDCGADGVCATAEGKRRAEAAQDKALVSTVAVAASGALLATAVVLYWTAPDGSPQAPSATLGLSSRREGFLGFGALRW